MARLKVVSIVGTRPEIIRLSRVMSALDRDHDHVHVHTGQNYDHELNDIFYEDLGIRKPDHYLEAAKDNPNQTISAVMSAADTALRSIKPDAVLVLGDTNSCIALLAAKKLKIPTFHMEAGNRCFDQRVPEETNRRLVDHIADINLPYSQIARDYLLREGLPPDQVIVTGSPMREVLDYYAKRIEVSGVLSDLGLTKGSYFVVSLHREENIDDPVRFSGFTTMLNELAKKFGFPVIVSTHPRTRNQIDRLGVKFHESVRLVKPLSFTEYVSLQKNAHAVMSDSGTISEESSILGFPAINLRDSHERPEAMEEAAVMMVGNNSDRLFHALDILESSHARGFSPLSLPRDYSHLNVSEKVSRIILSYTDFVNHRVWKK
jgi:UDP-N-acetylglucosamine 2-epimerase